MILKVFDSDYRIIYECTGCQESESVNNLSPGVYYTDIQFYDENWQFICEDKREFTIKEPENPCGKNMCRGDLVAYTQGQIDELCACGELNGSLTIGARSIQNGVAFPPVDINNLNALSGLRKITGSLVIVLTELENLEGLENLTELGSLTIIGNDKLTDLSALKQIQQLRHLSLRFNTQIKKLDDLEAIKQVGSIALEGNRLEELTHLSQINKDSLKGISIINCDELSSLEGLEGITNLNDILVTSNDQLKNIQAFSSIKSTNQLVIANNTQLSDCCAIQHLIDDDVTNGLVGGGINISLNAMECSSVEKVIDNCGGEVPCEPNICQGDITLRTQAEVDAFCGCEVIEGNLGIGATSIETADITSLANLLNLKEVKGGMSIAFTLLTDLDGLENLTSSLNFVVVKNPNLRQLDALTSLATVKQLLILDSNTALSETGNWSSLRQIGGLRVHNSDILNLNFLRNLENKELSRLEVFSCPMLESLNGLENITTVTDGTYPAMVIADNPNLVDISSLQNITLVENGLVLIRNARLEDCCSIAHLIDFDLDNGVANGLQQVEENAGDCFSNEAVLENCTDEEFSCDNIRVDYTDETLTISGLTAPIEIVKVFDKDWNQLFDCFADCPAAIPIPNLNSSLFRIQVTAYDENWNFLCNGDQYFEPAGSRTLNLLLPEDFTLSPNPAAETTTINLRKLEGEAITLQLFNSFGQEVYQRTIPQVTEQDETIDLAGFTNGLYVLKIKPDGKRGFAKKLVVNRMY
ncbi:MAG: T9SS type A sorting domain-containing protein [Bacteroidota bacterium]